MYIGAPATTTRRTGTEPGHIQGK